MSLAFRTTLLWVVGATIMVVFALMPLGTAYIDPEYIPANADAFYHGRRILDVVMTGQPVLQFDPKIHVPEGSWITWPWAFDSAMAHLTRLFGPFANQAEANRILMHIPVAAGALFIGVVLLLARQLGFSGILTTILVLAAAALPVIFFGFAVGNIDHHFAEGLWTAFMMCAGIWFFSNRESIAPAVVLGLVLATAVGVHNSLFILQIPVVLMFLLRWLQGEPLPSRRACIAFAATLALLTLAVCAPSEPWRQGFFEFYTLSWFHVYAAACTSLFCCVLAYLPRRTSTVWLILAVAAIATLPIVGVLGLAQKFMSGQLDSIQGITEVYSPYRLFADYGEIFSTRLYSWLLWLAAPMAAFNAWLAWKMRDTRIQFFAIAGAMGLVLLQLQYRFHVFGELALVATPLLAIQLAQHRWPVQSNRVLIAGCIAFVVMLVPTQRTWSLDWSPGSHHGYREVASAFPVLKEACAARPGIVLSDINGGHWVRYHSDCSVIGDVFLLTPQHAAKAKESASLMSLTAAELLGARQPVRYVLAYHQLRLVPGKPEPNLEEFRKRMGPLESELLGPLDRLPPQYRLLWSHTTPAGQTFARLIEIVR
jgi:hypothetical protein